MDLKWELFRSESRVKKLTVCKSLLAAACLLLTIGLGMALFRPVPVEGNDTYVTLLLENGETDGLYSGTRLWILSQGSHSAIKASGNWKRSWDFHWSSLKGCRRSIYIWIRDRTADFPCERYFEESAGAVAGYDAYFAGDREESYGYSYEISRDWERTETLSAGGREIVLYQINGLAAGQRAWGAAFSDDGVLYLFYSSAERRRRRLQRRWRDWKNNPAWSGSGILPIHKAGKPGNSLWKPGAAAGNPDASLP